MYSDWNRWIVASIIVKVQAALAAVDPEFTFEVMTEELDRGDNISQPRATEKKGVEFRYDGPWWHPGPNGFASSRLFISILLKYVPGKANIYTFPTLVGRLTEILADDLAVFKYGSEPGDDRSFVGCLPQKGIVQANNHGRRDMSANVFQATVATEYRGDLKVTL